METPEGTQTRIIAKAAIITTSTLLLARILGFIREVIIAKLFGATRLVDIYVAGFTIPDILYFLLSGGALSSAFIPLYTRYLSRNEKEEGERMFSSIFSLLFLAVTGAILIVEILAPHLVKVIVPHFSPSDLAYCTFLTRLMMPSVLFFILGGVLMGVAYSHQRFLIPAISGIVYNFLIIMGGWFLGPYVKVTGLSIGVVAGSFLGNFLIQFFHVLRLGVRPRFLLDWRNPSVQKVFILTLPVVISLSFSQLVVVINRMLASGLGEGAIASLNYANRLMQFPLGIFGQALGIAIFPTLSALAARGEKEELRRTTSLGVRVLFFLTIPFAFLFAFFAIPCVQIAYQRGTFTYSDTLSTAGILAFYAIGLPALSASQVVNRTFYSLQDPLTPLRTTASAAILCIVLNLILVHPLGAGGLALASSLSAYANLFHLLWIMRRRLGSAEGKSLSLSFLASTAISLLVSLPLYYLSNDLVHSPGHTLTKLGLILLFPILFLALSLLLRLEEARFFTNVLLRIRKS